MKKHIRIAALGWFCWSVVNELYKAQKRDAEISKMLLTTYKMNRIIHMDLVEQGVVSPEARQELAKLGTDLRFEAIVKDL